MMKVLLALAAPLVIYGVALVIISSRAINATQLRRAQEQKIAALGKSLAGSFAQMSTTDAAADACKGKLSVGPLRSLVVYTLAADPVTASSLDGRRLDGRIVGYSERYVEVSEPDQLRPELALGDTLLRFASPDEWPRRFGTVVGLRLETMELRYLAVAQFTEARLPSISHADKTFDTGHAEYKVKVVSFPDGTPVCEGIGTGRMRGEIIGHGSAKTDWQAEDAAQKNAEKKLVEKWLAATLGSPLHDLCFAGGEQLCFHASVLTEAPDW